MKKLRIKQVSSDSLRFMVKAGFRHQDWCKDHDLHASHMIPNEGKEFFVLYNEPTEKAVGKWGGGRKDYSGWDGTFALVRMDGEQQTLVEIGYAGPSHIHGGLDTLTFYGRGTLNPVGSWSFHCEREPLPLKTS